MGDLLRTTEVQHKDEALLDDAPIEDVIADTCERAEPTDDAGVTAVVTIDGAEPQLDRKPCKHPTLTFQNVAGTIDDEGGMPLRWVLRVRVRCSLCGIPFDAVPGTARDPQDHPIGIVFDLLPVDDPELAAGLPAHGD